MKSENINPKRHEAQEDLRSRTKHFASCIIQLFIGLDKSKEVLRVLGKQLLRSGTSVAANYREASRARSPQEFVAKIELCTQEADETQLWLELLRDDCSIKKELVYPLLEETNELISIFVTMSKRTKLNNR